MEKEINDVCKEVITILAYFDSNLINKIPSKVFNKINEFAADSELTIYIDKDKDLIDQNISEKSKDLIALLYYRYLATEEEKKNLSKIWNDNEQKYQKELNEKYNPENLFIKISEEKNDSLENSHNENLPSIDYKESFFTKLKNFVFNILHIEK